MKNGLKCLSAALVLVALPAAAGCACKGSTRATVRQSTTGYSKSSQSTNSKGSVSGGKKKWWMFASSKNESKSSPRSGAHGSMTAQASANPSSGGSLAHGPNPRYGSGQPASTYSGQGHSSGNSSTMLTNNLPASLDDLPPNANSGECWTRVFHPAQMKKVTERVCVKEASEKIEIVPAQFEWVDEQVCVKPASKQLINVPAQYETVTENLVLDPGHVDWIREDGGRCQLPGGGKPVGDVFCLVKFPTIQKSMTAERLVRPASIREIDIPAEYQTIRKQRMVTPASTRRVEIPAEFITVEKTVQVSPGRWEWQRVECERPTSGNR